MAWSFGPFLLDPDRHELTRDGATIHVEPQVFALLLHLVRHRDRMVTKDELSDVVWPDHAASDASIASRVKFARAALGDDGVRQAFIRTIHGIGFRFVASVAETASTKPHPPPPPDARQYRLGRPSIAVLPLRLLSVDQDLSVLAEAIPYEIIHALSRLRWLSVTARGSSFRFRQPLPDYDLVATSLGVRYVLSGVLENSGTTISVTLELSDCEKSEVIWTDRITAPFDSVAELRAAVVARIVASLEVHVPENEAKSAITSGTEDFDAWASYHLGLRHLYRFTEADNASARHYFERSTRLDPTLARAHAGLSFTSFIDAFLRIAPDISGATKAARQHAERGLDLDPLDPFVNFTMGRAHWLVNDAETARHWLSRATTINPNYAQGYYASAFTSMLVGDGNACEDQLVAALDLSPLDPLLYGMYGVRSQMQMQQQDYAAAAQWGEKAASTPGAHYLISMIAVAACGLAGEVHQARRWAEATKGRRAHASTDDYMVAFPIRDVTTRNKIGSTLATYGF